MLRTCVALLACSLASCHYAADCSHVSLPLSSFIRPPLHRPLSARIHHAAESPSPLPPAYPLKRVPLPSRDLPNFVTFNNTGAWDPVRHRHFSDSVVNFIRRAIEVWWPPKETQPGRKKRKVSGTVEWGRFLKACFVERKYLTLSSAALVGAAFCEVSVPHYSSVALNAVLVSRNMQQFTSAVRMLIILGCAASALTFVRAALFGLAGTRVATRARVQLLKSLLTQEMGFFDNRDSGELTNRLSADCAKLSTVISSHINVMLRQTIQLIGGSYYLFRLNAPLAWVTLTGVTAIGLLTTLHGEFIRRMGRRSQDALAQANAVAGQILSLIRVIRAHGSEEKELMRYTTELKRTVSMLETHDLGHSVYRSFVRFLQTLLQAAVMSLGAVATIQGRMTGEQLTAFLFYVNFVSAASFDVGDRWTSIQDAIGSTASVFSLTDRRPKLQIREDLKPRSRHHQQHHHAPVDRNMTMPAGTSSAPVSNTSVAVASSSPYTDLSGSSGESAVRGRMVFRNVTFAYPLRGGLPVLKNLNVVIPAGKKTAIVGGSGAGKSTLMRLMCRFYDPDQGAVLIDGRDVRTLTQKELTRRIVFLAQEPQLMPVSIYENIAYGLEEGTVGIEDVVRAAKDANVHDFILSLPQKYSTCVGENSVSLSGGQKQRIAVARALIRRPDVLLLDEPTSALDVESERVVAETLDLVSTGRTCVIIAHRLQTIKNVDWIIVMQNGRVAEEGTHSSLLAKQGVYAQLHATYKNALAGG